MDFKKILGYLDFNLTYSPNRVKTILTYVLFLKPLLPPSALVRKIEPTPVILIKFKIKSYMNKEWKIARKKNGVGKYCIKETATRNKWMKLGLLDIEN